MHMACKFKIADLLIHRYGSRQIHGFALLRNFRNLLLIPHFDMLRCESAILEAPASDPK